MAPKTQASEERPRAGRWATALFVVAVFSLLWVSALLRLHGHLNGETFLAKRDWTDSLLVLLAPAAILARCAQLRRDLKAR